MSRFSPCMLCNFLARGLTLTLPLDGELQGSLSAQTNANSTQAGTLTIFFGNRAIRSSSISSGTPTTCTKRSCTHARFELSWTGVGT